MAPKTVDVAVTDKGTGIAPGKLENAFEPFFADKPAGMGMGLSICRSIVQGHGGRIWASNNTAGGGSDGPVRVACRRVIFT